MTLMKKDKYVRKYKNHLVKLYDYVIPSACTSDFEFDFFLELLENNIYTFQELASAFKAVKDHIENESCLWALLSEEEFFKELFERNLIDDEDIKWLWIKITKSFEFFNLNKNLCLMEYIIKVKLFTMYEIVDKAKKTYDYAQFLQNYKLFELFQQHGVLTDDVLHYMFKKIRDYDEVLDLTKNIVLLKKLFSNFDQSKRHLNKLNRILLNHPWCRKKNLLNFFDLLTFSWSLMSETNELYYKEVMQHSQEIERLSICYNVASQLDMRSIQKQRVLEELLKLAIVDERVKNKLECLVRDQLVGTFESFDSLKAYLEKSEKKSLISI